LKKQKAKGRNKKRKQRKNKRQIKHGFGSEFNCV
jgi:hypothetical protein